MAIRVSTSDVIKCGGCGREVDVTSSFLFFVLREYPRSCSQRVEIDAQGDSFLYIETERLCCTTCGLKRAGIFRRSAGPLEGLA